MITGDPAIFAIESSITKAYERMGFRALGYFLIHVSNRVYGVRKPDATMLACSFDEVRRRIESRGKHTAPFAGIAGAGAIADAVREAIFAPDPAESFFDIPLEEFRKLFYTPISDRMWVPDGDEAFDDGSYVLQFDVDDSVRLIAFKSGADYRHDPATLKEAWLAADTFYQILERWRDAFEAEWASAPKVALSPELTE